MKLVFQSDVSGSYQGQNIWITNEWQRYSHTFTVEHSSDNNQLRFWYMQQDVTYFLDEVSVSPGDRITFNQNDEKLLSLIVRAMEASMHWHTEYQNMYEKAIKDGLTGLLNHKTFVDRASEEIERARRFQQHLVFLMYDLDKFKRINDTLGHPYGDYVIRTTAKIIKDNVRSIDLVARYGGEEFAVVLVNTTTEAAMTVAQRIVDNIADSFIRVSVWLVNGGKTIDTV